jgi:hypothetical protein
MDNVVVSWIIGTLTVEFQDIVREQEGIARQAWVNVEA